MAPPSPTSSALRVFARHPRLTAAGFLLGATYFGLRRGARNMAENDVRQKSRPESRLYVPVDRSGGGF